MLGVLFLRWNRSRSVRNSTMTFQVYPRLSDSPYVETITHGRTVASGSTIRPAETHWHMILTKVQNEVRFLVVGPLSKSGVIHYGADAEILWIKFKLGVFMPHLPVRQFLNRETPLPNASGQSFWLKGAAWQFPDSENSDTFINRLVHDEVLVLDRLVSGILQNQIPLASLSPRTVRHRFLRATGLSQSYIFQYERANRAVAYLQQGGSILDVVAEAGYFDQPHLTRSLKQFVGHTPAEIKRLSGCPAP